jgi:hypothetical protein
VRRAAGHVGEDVLCGSQEKRRALQERGNEGCLARVEALLAREHVRSDRALPADADFLELRGEAVHEELEPPGQVHVGFPHALERGVERGAVARSRS